MKPAILAALSFACFVLSCSQADNRSSESDRTTVYTTANMPVELETYVEKATSAFADLKSRLAPKLQGAINDGGPVHAISFCKVEAPKLHQDAAAGAGFEVGRTSHKPRNPANAPREWMKSIVETESSRPAEEVPVFVVDLGDRVGVMKPIGTANLCLQCHGNEGEVDHATRDALKKDYPSDMALGYAIGDVRGFFWAEMAKAGR